MPDFKDFADQLQQDVVSEMAETYFGDRKNLDEVMDGFFSMVDDFRVMTPKLYVATARLRTLLLDDAVAKEFFLALDIAPCCVPRTSEVAQPFFDSLPFAFSVLGRYERCLFRIYDAFAKAAHEYLNGTHYMENGRKRLTVHYLRLRALAKNINAEVNRINETMKPSGTLRYVKGMDTEQAERERLIGQACLVDGCGLDADLQFKPIDFNGLGFPEVQDMPPLSAVKHAIRDFCKTLYPSRKADMVVAMTTLREG